MIPDVQVDRVRRADGSLGWIADVLPEQPVETDRARVRVSDARHGGFDEEPRLCRWDGEAWVDMGASPDPVDEAAHPDLKGAEGDYVRIARDVLRMIPRGARIDVTYLCTRTGDDVDVVPHVQFVADHGEGGNPAVVPDCVLDVVPGVRHVERRGDAFAAMLMIEPYHDASGIPGEFSLQIAPDSLLMSYEDAESGAKLVLTSDLHEGRWIHGTRLHAHETETDAVETLRRLQDPAFALDSLFEGLHENPVATLLGVGSDDLRTEILSVSRERDAEGPIAFLLRPGGLR